MIDALGQQLLTGYDANGNVHGDHRARRAVGSPETGSQCGAAGTGNNADDDLDGVKDDGCPSTKYAYDALNRLQSTTDALSRITSYQYDAASHLSQRTDARGLVTKYFPDALNRLDHLEHWSGTTLVDSLQYTYDPVGNRTQMVESTGTTTYVPDALDRVSSITFPGPQTVPTSTTTSATAAMSLHPRQVRRYTTTKRTT